MSLSIKAEIRKCARIRTLSIALVLSVYVRQSSRCIPFYIGIGVVSIETAAFSGLSIPVTDKGDPEHQNA